MKFQGITRYIFNAYQNITTMFQPLNTQRPSSIFGQTMHDLAFKEIGVREIPKNSNLGPRVEEYQRTVGKHAVGQAWCAAFVSWAAVQAAKLLETKNIVPVTGSVTDMWRAANKKDLITFLPEEVESGKVKLLPGDIFIQVADSKFLNRVRDLEKIYVPAHVGICTGAYDPQRKEFGTIEGNTDASGSREGGGVYQRTRKLSERIVGFIRPAIRG